MSEEKKEVICKSPIAPAKWIFLAIPQPEEDDKKSPKYMVNLILDQNVPSHKQFLMSLVKAKKDFNVDTFPYKKETEGKGANKKETGFISVKVWSIYKPKVINSHKEELTQTINDIGNGSKVRVAYSLNAYPAGKAYGSGVSLYLQAVQLLEKIPYTANQVSLEDCGFNEEKEFEAVVGSALDVFEGEVIGEKEKTNKQFPGNEGEDEGDVPF